MVKSLGRRIVRWKDSMVVCDDKKHRLIKIQNMRKWVSIEKVYDAFKNPKTSKYEPKTWRQLLESGISKSTLSRILRDEVKENHIRAQVRVDSATKRMETVYKPVEGFWRPCATLKGFQQVEIELLGGEPKVLGTVQRKLIKRTLGRKPYYRYSPGEKVLWNEICRKADEIRRRTEHQNSH